MNSSGTGTEKIITASSHEFCLANQQHPHLGVLNLLFFNSTLLVSIGLKLAGLQWKLPDA